MEYPVTSPVTSTQASPVWITGALLDVFVTGAAYVTSSQAAPVWITGTIVSVAGAPTGTTYVTSSQAAPVWITGTITQVAGAPTGTTVVTSSQAAPVWITQSGGGSSVSVTNFPAAFSTSQGSVVTASIPGFVNVLVSESCRVDAGNSSVAALGANAGFTGTAVRTLSDFVSIEVAVSSNVASAASGVQLQFSPDGNAWIDASTYSYSPGSGVNTGQVFGVAARSQFYRTVYLNGGSAQASFLLQTILHEHTPPPDTIDISQALNDNAHAYVTKGLITGRSTAGPNAGIIDVKVSPAGALAVDASNSTNVSVTGSVNVTNLPATQPVSIAATVAVSQSNVQIVTSSQGSPVAVTGVAAISNFPATQAVSIATAVTVTSSQGSPVAVTGVQAISNFPATQTVAGTVTVTGAAGSVGITGTVAVTNFPASQTVAGTVTVTSSQGNPVAVTGVQAISNFPATQAVSIAAAVTVTGVAGSVGVTGSVNVTNFPASQTVAGTVTANQGTSAAAPWPVSSTQGSVVTASISNFPATQPVSIAAVVVVTGNQASPVWVTQSGGGSSVTVTNTPLPVTSTAASPVWVTQSGGGSSVTVTNVPYVTASSANPVWVTGTFGMTGSLSATFSGVMSATIVGAVFEGTDNDGEPVSSTGALMVESYPMTFNGTTWDRVRGVSGSAHALITTPAQSTAGIYATNFPAGYLRVTDEAHQLFYDNFDPSQGLDTTNRWNAPTSAGGGVAAAVTNGTMSLGTGPTVGGYSYLQTQPAFSSSTPGWIRYAWNVQVEFPLSSSAYRFWGAAVVGGAVTGTAPFGPNGSAIGFEVYTDGKMYAAMWNGSTRTVIASLSGAGQPADALTHNYQLFYRPTKCYWHIDNSELPLATSAFSQVLNVDTLRNTYLCLNTGSAALLLQSNAVSVADTAKNNLQLSDGQFPWRKARVDKSGSLAVTYGALPTYWGVVTGTIPTLAAFASASLMNMWNPTLGRRSEIINVTVALASGTGGVAFFKLRRQATNPTGGTALALSSSDANDAAPLTQLSRSATAAASIDPIAAMPYSCQGANVEQLSLVQDTLGAKPVVLRGTANEGLEVTAHAGAGGATGTFYAVTVQLVEI